MCVHEVICVCVCVCQMPVMNGLESTSIIRVFNVSVPIVAVTASVDESQRHTCLSVGMNDVLAKPVGAAKLMAVVRAFMAL